ncbi:unnamed protein product [Caenorhabditis sp. 36 PRJEB53466]|nr:unnamed protein product [Caenorhabditis sp. 36 PRJEB53466]
MVKVREKSELVTVNAGENLEKLMAKGYVHPMKHSALVPYFDELEVEADKNFQFILNGLMNTLLTDAYPEASEYCEMFIRHLHQFGLRMSKHTYLSLVRLFYEVIVKEHQRSDLMLVACAGFAKMSELCPAGRFGWRDLVLDWRPMYRLLLLSINGKLKPDPTEILSDSIHVFAHFYQPTEHAAIWETLLEELALGQQWTMERFTMLCWNFLSIQGMSEEDLEKYAVNSWFRELWNMYLQAEMNTKFTVVCVDYVSELLSHMPAVFDLSPYYDVIFTKMMRSFCLTVRDGKVSVGDGQEGQTLGHLAKVCAYTIGGPRSALAYFQRLMKYILFNVHPQNSGNHTDQIGDFLYKFISFFKKRIKEERLAYKKRPVPNEYYLKDAEIDAVTEAMTDLVIMLMFSEDYRNDHKLVYVLTAMNREYVAPKLLDHLYSSLTAFSEPHRLTVIMQTFSIVCFEVIRLPDADYRAPRNIVYDSKWFRAFEEQRTNWATYRTGSVVPQVLTHQFTSLRAHAFYMIEIFVNNIDVNDVYRTASVLRALVVLFSSFPLMDFSAAIEHHGDEMNDDDRILCRISKRVPTFVEFAFERILDVITCLSVVPAKSSAGVSVGVSMSTESQQAEGEEELILKTGICQCVSAIFERSDEKIKKRLFSRLFDYVSTSEFASYTATELLSGLVGSAIWTCPDAFKWFIEFVSKKLKALITEDVQKSKNPSSTVVFHVVLARAVYVAPHQLILKNEALLCEITDLLLKCQCKRIYRMGTEGAHSLLFTLLCINTEHTASPENQKFQRPLSEWNPIKEWAKCNTYKDTVIKWYIPARQEIECVQRVCNRFLFPYIQMLRPGQLDRDNLRRVTNHLKEMLQNLWILEHPKNCRFVPDIYAPYSLPPASSSLGAVPMVEFELLGANGENPRELLVSMVERMMPGTQDPKALINLAAIAAQCFGGKTGSFVNAYIEASLDEVHRVLMDSTYGRIWKASQHTMDELAFFKHSQLAAYHTSNYRAPNDFDQRIIACLLECALNDYEKVRDVAIAHLMSNISQIYRCRDTLVPKVMQVFTESDAKQTGRLIGAIGVMLDLGWLGSINARLRLVCYDAVLRIKVIDDPKLRVLFERIREEVKSIVNDPIYQKGTLETFEERNKTVKEFATPLIKLDEFWKPYFAPETISAQLKRWYAFEREQHILRKRLVDTLFSRHIHNPEHHHTRQKLARTMAYHVQREAADERTIRLLLSQLTDEQYEQRNEARGWLAYWMRKNKPQTVRTEVRMPPRKDHGQPMESGIREDNLWTVYDSAKVPDTEHKWNEMMFVEKEKGACRWPSALSVVRPRKHGPPLECRPMSGSDQAILDYFSDPKSVADFINCRCSEKDDCSDPNANFYQIVQYAIRNYPDAHKPLQIFSQTLKSLLLGTKRQKNQNLAAELFLGIALGLKHRTFAEQKEFWTHVTVALDEFFNTMLEEAETAWSTVILLLFMNRDLRRVWWLVESLIAGARKSTAAAATEFLQAFRFTILFLKRWRYTEITNRLVEIAWSKLAFALTDQLRYAIARVFRNAAQVCEMNLTATFVNVDPKFIPPSVDYTIAKMLDYIPQLKISNVSESARSVTSDTAVVTSPGDPPPAKKRRVRSLSAGSDSDKLSMAHFRTLLEYILQYYETSMHSWTPELVQILPKLMEFANEDDYDLSEETYRDVDITQNAAVIIHDYMSGAWLKEQFVGDIVHSWCQTYSTNMRSWKIRRAVVKFVQASVYSNIFPLSLESRRSQVEKLLFEAVTDEQISIRREASKCLLLFVHCGYIKITDEMVDALARVLNSSTESESKVHGAVLALGALVLAFPFSLPLELLKPLRILNSSSCKRALIKDTITSIVREFRRQHRDDWNRTKEILGETLTFDIENATAPAYYA